MGFVEWLIRHSSLVLIILGVLWIASAMAFGLAYRRAKTAPFFLWREEAAVWARRWAGLCLLLAVGIAAAAWISFSDQSVDSRAISPQESVPATNEADVMEQETQLTTSPTAMTPSPTLPRSTSTATSTPSPTATPSQSASPTATVAEDPTETPPFTPTPDVSEDADSPSLEILTLAAGVSDEKQPVDLKQVFTRADGRVYVFFSFSNMHSEMEWAQVWLREEEEIQRETEFWPWGHSGWAYVSFSPPDGFELGGYQVQLYVEGLLLQEVSFVVE